MSHTRGNRKLQRTEDDGPSRFMMRKVDIAADAICRAYDISFEDLIRKGRHWRVVWPRWVLAVALHDDAGMYPKDVASVLNIDSRMVTYARIAVAREVETNPKCRELYEQVMRELRPKLNRALKGYPIRLPKQHNKRKDRNGDHRECVAG